MKPPAVATRAEWLDARGALLDREKAFTRERDALSAARRQLPWVRIDRAYEFTTEAGPQSLRDLFGAHDQLVIYHFMFGPDWEEGCPSCSFWMDSLDGTPVHLAHRGTAFVAVSRAPLDRLLDYRARMAWQFPWVSSHGTSFNEDFHVSFPAGSDPPGAEQNDEPVDAPAEEAPGMSAFARDGDVVYHTYSTYSRGLDILNSAYNVLDLTAKGRDEGALPWTMAWLHRHDEYPG